MAIPLSSYAGDSPVTPNSWIYKHKHLIVTVRKTLGFILTANFLVFWSVPVFLQGWAYRSFLSRFVRPVYDLVDKSPRLRKFAFRYIYSEEYLVDYFATAIFFLAGFLVSLVVVFSWQIYFGTLPWWLIAAYYFSWVGFGGRSMGAAYTFAHREGHTASGHLYRPWIRNRIGNFFENWVGFFYGNIPYNFSTAHVLLHHRLNGGKGDPFYMWDIDRTRLGDMLLYVWRIFIQMTGWGGLRTFGKQRQIPQMDRAYRQLRKGIILYWLVIPTVIVVLLWSAGSSPVSIGLFLFFIYFQALFAMAFFLTIINVGFHGFIEFDADGKFIPCICSNTIVDGYDDSFGEDDHMAHHYFGQVTHDGLTEHQTTQHPLWARHHASVFRNLSILELGINIYFKRFRKLAQQHYLDFSGDLDVDRIEEILRTRATRKEMDYEHYEFRYLPQLEATARKLVRNEVCENVRQAYVYQAHRDHNKLFVN